ncbi:class I SAM-dependent methyltransferase [Marmoricola sp. URHB0036]|uniref:class I SAM-dependent methyltransferase n=1 Tax=Marmoricola sp. URHB0036 TaxID=1298863 RepID=UPI0003F6BD4C|nr:class I SAM-dependent methyltransferase [Marmoricola sp. URHB0036]
MSDEHELPEHAARNREHWDEMAAGYVSAGERQWGATEASWGIWNIPESELHLLDGVEGLDAIELGCGTAYVSAWLARRGARPVGIDNSPNQLDTARRLQHAHGLEFPLLLGNAEHVPYPDASFDFAISEYGACLWADPYVWVAEAARLLRPGGRLVFLTNGYLLMLCAPDDEDEPATDRLLRSSFGMHRFEWPDDPSVEFHLAHGDWVRVLRANGFEVEDLIELQAPGDATSNAMFVSPQWAQRWPSEEVWIARKRG